MPKIKPHPRSVAALAASVALTIDGITFAGPAWDAARKACQTYLPAGAGRGPKLSPSEMAIRLARSECMRIHEVPNFPDPNARGGVNLPLTIDTKSPPSSAPPNAATSPN
jgi:hypothetical protein